MPCSKAALGYCNSPPRYSNSALSPPGNCAGVDTSSCPIALIAAIHTTHTTPNIFLTAPYMYSFSICIFLMANQICKCSADKGTTFLSHTQPLSSPQTNSTHSHLPRVLLLMNNLKYKGMCRWRCSVSLRWHESEATSKRLSWHRDRSALPFLVSCHSLSCRRN